jgi:hypothetical protein
MRPNPLAEFRDELIDPSTGNLDLERATREVLGVVCDEDEALELSNLRSVRSSSDYPALVAGIAKEVGKPLVATDRHDARGMAMVIHGPDGDVLALHTGLLQAVFGSDGDLADLALWTVHHELSHVHDWAVKTRNIGPEPYSRPPSCFFAVADLIWSEYFADRRSFPSMPGGKSVHADVLVENVARIAGTAKAALAAALIQNSPKPLMDVTLPAARFLLTLAAYVLGALAGAGRTVGEEYPSVAAAITGSCLEKAWPMLAGHLDEMAATHGMWSGVEVYRPLEDAVESVFARLGMEFCVGDGGQLRVRPVYSVLAR